MTTWSKTWTYVDGDWLEGNPPLTGPRSHAFWLGSSVFDGARVFDGLMPDMDMHAARVNRSAVALGLKATMSAEDIIGLARDGARKFDGKTPLYVKPMYWAETDGPSAILPDPESTRFCLCLYEAPMGAPTGTSITLSKFRRPTIENAPTDSKAGCLYPNNGRALREAKARGCVTIPGVRMQLHQAAAQFRLYTGSEPDLGLMEEALAGATAALAAGG